MVNDRIQRLRRQSLEAVPTISLERARLLTEFYHSGAADKVSIPVARALALKYFLERKRICINSSELIVGERGPEPKATPTYPEICTHSLQDFDVLDSREKIPFAVDSETRQSQADEILACHAGYQRGRLHLGPGRRDDHRPGFWGDEHNPLRVDRPDRLQRGGLLLALRPPLSLRLVGWSGAPGRRVVVRQ